MNPRVGPTDAPRRGPVGRRSSNLSLGDVPRDAADHPLWKGLKSETVARFKSAPVDDLAMSIFRAAAPFPGVVPKDHARIAMDSANTQINAWAPNAWAAVGLNSVWNEGLTFLGYAYLSELAQRPEYRRISEVIATEMTRKWIKLQVKSGDDQKTDKIAQLEDALERFKIREAFFKLATQDGFFGRTHLFVDVGDSDDRDELVTPIGDGKNKITKGKVKRGSINRFTVIEPIWCYPSNYNADDPTKPDWYNPVTWFVMSKEIHRTRLMTLVGREVPDILKPAYAFGGLSMSQMAKPYVDNWIQTRTSVNKLIQSFSFTGLKTNLQDSLMDGGEQLFNRLALLTNIRNNQSTIVLNQGEAGVAEEFFNVSVPLGTLDALQAQAQEHMAAVSGIPLIKLLGITPHGLNASSDGEIRTFYDWIHAYQVHLFSPTLTRVIDFVQMNEFGAVDPDITFAYELLWSLDDLQEATKRKMEADVDVLYIQEGVVSPREVRLKVATDPDTPYEGMDVDDMPELPEDPDSDEDMMSGEDPDVPEKRPDPSGVSVKQHVA